MTSNGNKGVPQKKTTYDWSYSYTGNHPHAPTQIGERRFLYDGNGNQLAWDDLTSGKQRTIKWDEDNKVEEIADNGRTTRFIYDDAGDRVIKRGAQGETAYVNQFWTVRNRSIATKHVFVGETRVASKLSPGDSNIDPNDPDRWMRVLGKWWLHRSQSGWDNGKNTEKNPHYTGGQPNRRASVMPDGEPDTNFLYFYHPDHLGSTAFVTDTEGELYEHVEYFAFGETWVSQQSNTQRLPYLYTSKELDEETGLYYFGARYYDPRTSVWQSPDPALPRFLDRQSAEGGVYMPMRLSVFSFSGLRPLILKDPDGEDWKSFLGGVRDQWIDTAKETAIGTVQVAVAVGTGKMSPQVAGTLAMVALAKDVATLPSEVSTAANTPDDYQAGRSATKVALTVAAVVATVADGVGAAKSVKKVGPWKVGTYRETGSHHIIQEAAVRDLPGYDRRSAPAVDLGDVRNPQSPHAQTRPVQRQAGGGTYASERRIGYKALRKAGVSPSNARTMIETADRYFESIGVTPDTPTRIPGDRH